MLSENQRFFFSVVKTVEVQHIVTCQNSLFLFSHHFGSLVAVGEKTCKAGFERLSVKSVPEPLLPRSHFVAHVHSDSILAFFHPDSEQAQFRLVLLAVP